MKFKRTRSRCGECPLAHKNRVWGTSGIDNPKVILLGEAPGEKEDAEREPFVGPAGAMLKQVVARSGIIWHTAHRMNVICCRPPENEIDSEEGKAAIKCCREGFLEELEALKKAGATVVVPLGNTAAEALGLSGKVTKIRGSVFPLEGITAVPTYHPSFIMRGMWHEEPTWAADLAKAYEISLKKWVKPKEKFNLFPSVEDVKEFCARALKKKALVAVDIETTSLSPYHSKIIMVGLGLSGEEVLVVPFTKKGGADYWSLGDESKVRAEVKKVLKECPTLFQNGMFDVRHLEQHGYTVGNYAEDTMLLHHVIHPELPHNLEYIVSIYGKTPAWKHVVKGQADRMINMDDTEVRTYNARDTAVLHQIFPELKKDAVELGVWEVYKRFSMRLTRPLLEMSKEGMLIDKKKIASLSRKFKKDEEKLRAKIIVGWDLPEEFNLESTYHMQALVYGIKPKLLGEWKKELAAYDEPGCKKKKTTKKYLELAAKVKVYESIKPIRVPDVKVRGTSSGKALDDEAFLQIQRGCFSRIEALEGRVKKLDEAEAEKKELRRTLEFAKLYGEWSQVSKMAGTYSGYPVGPDGRVHPNYKIHGTATSRLSCSDPNLQNQPEEVQGVFVAGPGRVIIKADYSNIEYRVMARMTGETELEAQFAAGQNFHDINTRLLFGIEKGDPMWGPCRRVAKTFIFGLSYGGGLNGIYNQILAAGIGIELSFSKFKAIVDEYFEKLANYKKWRDAITKQARETRCVETAFGFKRFLLGTPDEIERQALNTPIQGTASEITEEAICDCYDSFEKPKHKEWRARLGCTVHDSILVECQEEYKMEVAREMKKIMEKPYVICGKPMSFPVDIEVGPSWGETEVVEV